MTETMSVIKPKINPEYSEMLSPMSPKEFDNLKQSLLEEGQHEPIILNQNQEIIDGHNRFKAYQELEIEPYFEIQDFESKQHEKALIIANANRKPTFKVNRKSAKSSLRFSHRGAIMYLLDLYDEALSVCQEAIKLDFTNPQAFLVLGLVYRKRNLLDRAIDNFDLVSGLTSIEDETNARAVIQMGACYAEKWEFRYAQYFLKEAIKQRPKYEENASGYLGLIEIWAERAEGKIENGPKLNPDSVEDHNNVNHLYDIFALDKMALAEIYTTLDLIET